MEDNDDIGKILPENLRANFTIFDITYLWIKRIKVCSNEVPTLFRSEIITKYRKLNDKIEKISTEPLGKSPRFRTQHNGVRGINVCSNEGSRTFPR